MSLKDIINSVHQAPKAMGVSCAEMLDEYLEQKARAPRMEREPGYHPSQMFKYCPRQEILKFFWPKPEVLTIEQQIRFDWGSAWHYWLQNNYFGPMGVLWGKWRCNKCGEKVEGFMPKNPCKCGQWCVDKCDWPGGYTDVSRNCSWCNRWGRWTYKESRIEDKEWGLVGAPDGIFILSKKPDGERDLAEFKTIDEGRLKGLREPDPGYVYQVNIYMGLTGLKRCLLQYWSKGNRELKPVEFVIKYDPAIMEDVKKKITEHRRVWQDKRLCARKCESATDPSGKYCLWNAECYNRDIDNKVDAERRKHGLC